MFNTQHILYMVISGALTAVLLIMASKLLKERGQKDRFLKFFAILTVVLHYSNLWVDYFKSGGHAEISSVHILPIYPCNVMMWLLLVVALMKKSRRIFPVLAECCFYVGTICGVLGIALNKNFDSTPTLADYDVLKGMLSHSAMLLGCIYIKVGGYIRIRPFNAVSTAVGLGLFILCGIGINQLYDHFGMEAPDAMFLRENPYFRGSPILPGLCVVILMFLTLTLLERRKNKKK